MIVDKVFVRYCANYNGCHLTDSDDRDFVTDVDGIKELAQTCSDEICDALIEYCDEGGEFSDDHCIIHEKATRIVQEHFGDHVLVYVSVDEFST